MTMPGSTHPLFSGIGGHHSQRARTDEWLTPPHVIAALGGASSFDLDPCAPVVRPWSMALEHYTVRDNGLILPWRGRIWLNPPYSRTALPKWLGRMADHGRGVALIFARTETDAFFRFVWERCSAVLFLRGRLTFCTVDGFPARKRDGGDANGGAPSVLCAYGDDDAQRLMTCGLPGQFLKINVTRTVL